ncbi:hypothetical protein [Sphingomonas sp. Leaf257]|uniref:hypothetical protein n=1 Tax=Sphingomonas sp. Leaf257 TaxID=1736309 RepID=UPI000B1A7DEB|nr:hypothetical protein [Sphingomonas sp. Leaf257]
MIRLAALGRFWPLIPILLLAVWGWRVDQLRAVHLLDLTKERGDRRAEVAEAKQEAASAEAAHADRIATATERYAAAMADRQPIILHSKDTVTRYAQTDAGRFVCRGPDRVRDLDALDAALFTPSRSADSGLGTVRSDAATSPAGR